MRNILPRIKNIFFVFIVFFVLILLFNNGLWNTFFQQDEWNGFGTVLALSHSNPLTWFGILGVYHFIPLSQFFYFLLYKAFGYQVSYFSIVSLLLHSIASTLVYFLAKKITKNTFLGISIATLFAFNANTSQAYLHLAIFPATITCFIGVMLFMIYLVNLPKKHILTVKDAIVLLTIFYISICLREDALVLILVFPLWLVLFQGIKQQKKNKKFLLIFGSGVFLFFLFRVILQIFSAFAKEVATQNYFAITLQNLFWFFPKIIAQVFINGNNLFIFLLNHSQTLLGTPIDFNAILKYALPTTLFFLFLTFFFIILAGFISTKDSVDKKIILFAIGWIIAYSILLSSVGRQMDLVESRYLYFPSFGVLLAFIVAINSLRKSINLRYRKLDIFIKAFLLFIAILFLSYSYKDIRTIVHNDIVLGNVRKSIIGSLLQLHPTIPRRTVIFVRCKGICHKNEEFGISNKAELPFSSGPGYIFLLQYAKKNENAYADFFKKQNNGIEFLWDFESEGYKEVSGYGFGYFIDEDLLKKAVKENMLPSQSIIGLEYNEDTFTLKDISSQVQREVFTN